MFFTYFLLADCAKKDFVDHKRIIKSSNTKRCWLAVSSSENLNFKRNTAKSIELPVYCRMKVLLICKRALLKRRLKLQCCNATIRTCFLIACQIKPKVIVREERQPCDGNACCLQLTTSFNMRKKAVSSFSIYCSERAADITIDSIEKYIKKI